MSDVLYASPETKCTVYSDMLFSNAKWSKPKP